MLLGIAGVAGGLLFAFAKMLVLGISYAHDSSPTAEFRAAGNASMFLGVDADRDRRGHLLATRRKHLLIVGVAAASLVPTAAIAAWLDHRAERSGSGSVTAVEASTPAPLGPR